MPGNATNGEIELQPIRDDVVSLDSLRSSLDEDCFLRQNCDVIVHDNVPAELEGTTTSAGILLRGYTRHRVPSAAAVHNTPDPGSQTSIEQVRQRFKGREPTRTRWVNIIGWSRGVADLVTEFYLDNHNCLQLENLSQQLIGGPVKSAQGPEIVWIQTQMWFIGERLKCWNSLRSINFRMIVCLPTETQAGTLITNFAGPFRLADEISAACVNDILDYHPIGRQALGCVWILSFAILRMMAEQINFAFEIFDPANIISKAPRMPRLEELPKILEQANNLGRIDRYLNRLDEFVSFFLSVRELLQPDDLRKPSSQDESLPFRSDVIRRFAKFEAERARQKIVHEKSLCKSYIAPFDNLIQMMISYSTTQITSRLDAGRRVGEQLSKIGIIVAAITGIISPLSLITSFYGMNVKEFTPEAVASLYGFWKVGLPVLLSSVVLSAFLGLWLFVNNTRS